ncbi:MAG: EthD family reductase [Thermomicrobiales bacterium]|nr:EthD family reductase [Thermomicrobiales bacterium]
MHHVVFLVKKRPDMSQEEFARYWIDDHTPLTAAVEGVRAYRCYPASGASSGAPFDGVAVLSFDDADSAERALASPEFAQALADAANFQDVAATTSFVADERIIV